jgi:adenylate cyclase
MARTYRPTRGGEASTSSPGPSYCFGHFCLDTNDGLLLSDGRALSIRPKTLALLALFVTNPGRVLTHDAIVEAVWPGIVVTDESIAQCVRDLRRVLKADLHSPIRTVPRRGYIFTAEVSRSSQLMPPNEPESVSNRRPANLPNGSAVFGVERPILVISNFRYLDLRPEDAACGQFALEEIKTELACSRDLLLAPCAADDHGEAERIEPARLAREGARYLLEGSFHRGAGVFRMTLRIIDLALNIYVWGKQYDRKSRRLFPVQTELGCTAARDVEYAVAAAEQRHVIRRNVDQLGAWALFRRGLWHLGNSSRFDNDRAGDCFRRAIAVDPCFTLGHAGLALVHFNEGAVYLTRSTAESMELARSLVGAALRLDPDNAGARINGGIIAVGAGRLDDAWEQVEEALPAGSERPWAWGVQGTIEQWDGKPRQGRANLLNALRASPRDPQNAVLMGQVVISHYAEGDYAGTVKQALRTLARYPDCPLPWGWLTAAYGQLGDKDLARQALHETTLRAPHSLRQRAKGPNPWMRPSDYSHTVDGLEKAGWRRRDWET